MCDAVDIPGMGFRSVTNEKFRRNGSVLIPIIKVLSRRRSEFKERCGEVKIGDSSTVIIFLPRYESWHFWGGGGGLAS